MPIPQSALQREIVHCDANIPRVAIKSPFAIALFLILTILVLGTDLVSKKVVFDSLLTDPVSQNRLVQARTYHPQMTAKQALSYFRKPFVLGVNFTLSTNEGVAFGLFVPRLLIAVFTVLTIGLIFYFFASSPAESLPMHIILALILGGALGNLYDRLFCEVTVSGFEGIRYQVRDFIDCTDLHYPWVFNVADVFLVVGIVLLLLHMFVSHHKSALDKKKAQLS